MKNDNYYVTISVQVNPAELAELYQETRKEYLDYDDTPPELQEWLDEFLDEEFGSVAYGYSDYEIEYYDNLVREIEKIVAGV